MNTSDRYVYVQRPPCPRCHGTALKTKRSIRDQGDGSTCRSVKCLGCGHDFFLIIENGLPDFGNRTIHVS